MAQAQQPAALFFQLEGRFARQHRVQGRAAVQADQVALAKARFAAVRVGPGRAGFRPGFDAQEALRQALGQPVRQRLAPGLEQPVLGRDPLVVDERAQSVEQARMAPCPLA